MACPII